MKRTTIAIETEVLRTLKERALKDGTSLTGLANRLIRLGLKAESELSTESFDLDVHDCGSMLVDISNREILFDVMDSDE
jgi:hypothetical protein